MLKLNSFENHAFQLLPIKAFAKSCIPIIVGLCEGRKNYMFLYQCLNFKLIRQ